MTIWIVTTGNSDVQLAKHGNWESLYEKVRYTTDIQDCDKFLSINKDEVTKLFPIPARVLGIVYENQLEQFYEDLAFPLLDTFTKYFEEHQEYPSIIIVLLTDQRNIFTNDVGMLNENAAKKTSPYWQDTYLLKPIVQKYFEKNKNFSKTRLLFFTLQPQIDNGLDHWNTTLTVVKKALEDVKQKLYSEQKYNPQETVYVSHQAGIPAISSAVQFVSLSKFKNVKFLSSNIFLFYEDSERKSEAEVVDVSNYWQEIQIEKAKQLTKNGLPSAASLLLEEINYEDKKNVKSRLKDMVNVFNICSSLTQGNEFEVKNAIQRVVDALALIEIFLREKNYIQGITLLAAAHETFLKAAILNEIYSKYEIFDLPNYDRLRVREVIHWNEKGLGFIENGNYLKNLSNDKLKKNIKEKKEEILSKISFPVKDENICKQLNGNFSVVGKNRSMVLWLSELRPDFQPWDLLTWIGTYEREREADRRNQLMHNLRGVSEQEVIKYLLGNPDNPTYSDVVTTYQEAVKIKFLNEINRLGLDYNENSLYEQLKRIADDI